MKKWNEQLTLKGTYALIAVISTNGTVIFAVFTKLFESTGIYGYIIFLLVWICLFGIWALFFDIDGKKKKEIRQRIINKYSLKNNTLTEFPLQFKLKKNDDISFHILNEIIQSETIKFYLTLDCKGDIEFIVKDKNKILVDMKCSDYDCLIYFLEKQTKK